MVSYTTLPKMAPVSVDDTLMLALHNMRNIISSSAQLRLDCRGHDKSSVLKEAWRTTTLQE